VRTPRLPRLAGLAGSGLLLIAAGAMPVSAADDAMVRVLHGSPDAPSVDVFVDDAKVDALSGAAFGDLTEYVAVPAGTYAVKVCATADSSVCPIGPIDLTLEAGTRYTVAASDLLAQIKADVFVDGNARNGTARARVVHLSADTPAVDVLTQDGNATVVEGLEYPDATGYLDLEPGAYDLKVCASADTSVCPLDPGSLDLAGGTAYSVFAIGSLEGGEGVEGLTAVVGIDDRAAPATDTALPAGPEGTDGAGSLWAAVLGASGLVGLVAGRRFLAPARNRSR
jgi:hypothetical protein